MPDDGAASPLPLLPPGFVLGTASSAYQTEGDPRLGSDYGAGTGTVWERFTPSAGGAADSYRRRDEDLDLLDRLGAGGHRFSISWARVQPDAGEVDASALDQYDRLVDGLLERGIAPMVTLSHWDLPQWLEDDGGWLNRATIDRFADYAALVGERLADRVAAWVPVNAPALCGVLGYGFGVHAPGRDLGFESLRAVHHQLVAHGRGVVALRAAGAAEVGCANNHAPMWPASQEDADVGASKLLDALWNGLQLESMLLGRYPADLMPLIEPLIEPGDLSIIRQPLDFYGVSYYRPIRVSATVEGDMPFSLMEPVGYPTTAAGYAIVPDALREWLIMVRARFRNALPPLVVTECGAAFDDVVGPDGTVDDAERIDFLRGHLHAVETAIMRGVDVRGFYGWTLLDGFAWSDGYDLRYGLVHVDFDTRVRTPKRSFEWFGRLAAAQPTSPG